MSSWRRQTVLRMPGRTVGLGDIDDFRRFESAHEDKMDWAPHHFAPSLCGTEQGTFFDYILRDCWIPHPGGGSRTFCRELTPAEHRRAVHACAVYAYYRISRLGRDVGVGSFKAGDVQLVMDESGAVAEKLWQEEKTAVADIVAIDDGFSFRAVRI